MKLYIEKYDVVEQVALLDFVSKEDFCYFRNKGDWNERMEVNVSSEDATMLLISGIKVTNLRKGGFLLVDKQDLLELYKYQQNDNIYNYNLNFQTPSTIFMEVSIPKEFSNIFKYENSRHKDYHLLKSNCSWMNMPCALNTICTNVCVYNVGQGNCNRVYNDNNQTYFDYGASVLFSKVQIKNLLNDMPEFDDKTSLIISHWDADHCNMLKFIDDEKLNKLCCAFVPSKCISLTSQIIAEKLLKYCSYVVVINEADCRRIKRKISMHKVFENDNAALYVGENSTSINNSGLLLFVKGKSKTIILAGDHNNWQVFNNVYLELDASIKEMPTNVIVPHHGGKAGSFNNLIKVKEPNIAAVSVGRNHYGHPTTECRNYYCKNGFKWMSTMTSEKNVEFEI